MGSKDDVVRDFAAYQREARRRNGEGTSSASTATKLEASSNLRGNLSNFQIVDIAQMLVLTGKCGVLSVDDGAEQTLVYFDKNRIEHAQKGNEFGEEVFYELVRVKEGRFHFTPGEYCRERSIHKDPAYLLMEAARLADEHQRAHDHCQLPVAKPQTTLMVVEQPPKDLFPVERLTEHLQKDPAVARFMLCQDGVPLLEDDKPEEDDVFGDFDSLVSAKSKAAIACAHNGELFDSAQKLGRLLGREHFFGFLFVPRAGAKKLLFKYEEVEILADLAPAADATRLVGSIKNLMHR